MSPDHSIGRFALVAPGTEHRLDLSGSALHGFDAAGGPLRFEQLEHGIFDLISPARRPEFDAFAAAYAAVRDAENRQLSPDEVRRLPMVDPTHRFATMWAQRQASFAQLVSVLEAETVGTVVDIGAGCGWLAAQLANRHWDAAALDVTVDGVDGLAAARHHRHNLLLIRAEMEALPFARDSVDVAVFNASLHYAGDVAVALAEARRIVAPGGIVAIVDSPIFSDAGAGHAMVAEFDRAADQRLGVPAAPLAGRGFIGWDELEVDADTYSSPWTTSAQSGRFRRKFHAWRGARRAGRQTAERPLLVTRKPAGNNAVAKPSPRRHRERT